MAGLYQNVIVTNPSSSAFFSRSPLANAKENTESITNKIAITLFIMYSF